MRQLERDAWAFSHPIPKTASGMTPEAAALAMLGKHTRHTPLNWKEVLATDISPMLLTTEEAKEMALAQLAEAYDEEKVKNYNISYKLACWQTRTFWQRVKAVFVKD